MEPSGNQNNDGQEPSGNHSDAKPGCSRWCSTENDSEPSNSPNKPEETQTTSTSAMDESNLNNIPDHFQQMIVSPVSSRNRKRKYDGSFVNTRNFVCYLPDYDFWQSSMTVDSNSEMTDQATDVSDPKNNDKPRKKIKAYRLETRIRRMSFRRRKAYKKKQHCSSGAHPPKKNETTPKRKLRRKPRVLKDILKKSSDDWSGEVSPY